MVKREGEGRTVLKKERLWCSKARLVVLEGRRTMNGLLGLLYKEFLRRWTCEDQGVQDTQTQRRRSESDLVKNLEDLLGIVRK